MDWRHRAACRDEDPELFFPIGTSGPALLQVEQAKAVCRRCSVSDECLKWALESGQDAGVWGGMSEEERRVLKRRGGWRMPPVAPAEPKVLDQAPAEQPPKRRRGRPPQTHCKRGHPLSGNNVWLDRKGHKACRICHS